MMGRPTPSLYPVSTQPDRVLTMRNINPCSAIVKKKINEQRVKVFRPPYISVRLKSGPPPSGPHNSPPTPNICSYNQLIPAGKRVQSVGLFLL